VTNPVIKPRFDRLVNQKIAGTLATANDDPILATIHFSVDDDAPWHRAWTTTLLRHLIEDTPANAEVVSGWIQKWSTRASPALEAFAATLAEAPVPLDAKAVAARITNDVSRDTGSMLTAQRLQGGAGSRDDLLRDGAPVHRCDRRAGIDARPADLRGWGIRSVLRRTYSPRTYGSRMLRAVGTLSHRHPIGVPMTTASQTQQQPIRSTIPARLDSLRWSPFHTRLVLGLGTAWVLDGLSITIASPVTSKLTQPDTLHLTTTEAASIGTVYLIGEVIGALVFGKLSDNIGRRKLFVWTLAVYLVGTGLTALTPKGTGWIVYLYATRIIAGMGIGGEYSAINSAIDEMMPARYRGRTDVWINGSYWLGAIIGTFATFLILSSFRTSLGWRIAFLVGPALAFVIIFVRRNLPESPRWLITHGRVREAEQAIRRIEEEALRDGQHLEPVPDSAAIVIRPEKRYGYLTLLRVAFRVYPRRAVLGATLMITQSYNAIFFTYALVLTRFYHVSNNNVPLYGLAFAVGNLAGPLILGHRLALGRARTGHLVPKRASP
jgi:MFS family permease